MNVFPDPQKRGKMSIRLPLTAQNRSFTQKNPANRYKMFKNKPKGGEK